MVKSYLLIYQFKVEEDGSIMLSPGVGSLLVDMDEKEIQDPNMLVNLTSFIKKYKKLEDHKVILSGFYYICDILDEIPDQPVKRYLLNYQYKSSRARSTTYSSTGNLLLNLTSKEIHNPLLLNELVKVVREAKQLTKVMVAITGFDYICDVPEDQLGE